MGAAVSPTAESIELPTALRRGVEALLGMQQTDGSWEGECVWNPMLTAQYAITAHIIRLELDGKRRVGILTQFKETQNANGLWGLHPFDEGSLFVTTLVYVAARLLGADADESWLQPARRLFESEGGVQSVPTWGKAWLALLGLYGWEGVYPIPPEVWFLPSWVPIHPANYYCHTRLIYLGLGTLYGARFVADPTPETEALRAELYPNGGYDAVDFTRCADLVRPEDAPFRPSLALRALFSVAGVFEDRRPEVLRRRVLREARDWMRRDLRASDYLSLSPVNGLLSILALYDDDPNDPDLRRAIERFETWFWDDASEGSRVAGAKSVCWDSAFALQAMATLPEPSKIERHSMERCAVFLTGQQIRERTFDHRAAYRVDPVGGWCFSEILHGWPVSDCTAEAVLGLLHSDSEGFSRDATARAVRFMLRCQNPDGGFGSYESGKTRFPLEWMNPAEMFGRCMTERSYVECTASCVMALAEVRSRHPGLLRREIDSAIRSAGAFLLDHQNEDGTWDAAWGVRYIYATMFGVRGLLATGVPSEDPRIRRACHWLSSHQRSDGGWGELQPRALDPGYQAAGHSSAVQTAWALITLLEAGGRDRRAIDRAVGFLESTQLPSGEWADGEFVGVFFETALLNYRLYRQYFPVMALGMHARALTGQGRLHASTAPSIHPAASG